MTVFINSEVNIERRKPRHGDNATGWRSQDSVDSLSPRLVNCLELLRTDAGQITMAARAIVERIDVVGHIGRRQRSTLIDLCFDTFLL
jgi:hypothetical protein